MIRTPFAFLLAISVVGCEPFSPTYDAPSCSTRAECPGGFFCEEGACIGTCAGGLPPDDDGICAPKIFCDGEKTHASIADALADLECTTISLRAGTFRERLEISRSISIQGSSTDEVILHGQTAGTVVTIAEGAVVTLRALSITKGLADVGGGILNRGALTLEGVTVGGNRAVGEAPSGGGIANLGGSLTLIGSTVADNQVLPSDAAPTANRELRGGGISSTGGKLELLDNSEVRGNQISAPISRAATVAGLMLVAEGGGVATSNTVVQLRSSAVRENVIDVDGGPSYAAALGGGLWLNGGSFTATIAAISDNKSYATSLADVGAHAIGGGLMATGTVVELSSSQIRDNLVRAQSDHYPAASGGGMRMSFGSLNAVEVQVIGNIVTSEDRTEPRLGEASGGGIWTADAKTTLVQAEVCDNRVSSDYDASGAGMEIRPGSPSRIERATFRSNTASSTYFRAFGGGIHAASTGSSGATLAVVQTTINGNSAVGVVASGGGLNAYLAAGQEQTIDLISSTVSGNLTGATGSLSVGGGVAGWIKEVNSRLIINFASSTIANNRTSGPMQFCGGICLWDESHNSPSQLTLRNSIVASNLASNSPDCLSTQTSISGEYNLVGNPSGCSFSGVGHLTGEAGLLDLADNGGSTATHALASTSRAVNAGAPGGCRDAAGNALSVDQRGQPRNSGARCDIGAFER